MSATKMVKQGEFDSGVNIKAMANAGLMPKSNYQIHDRYTQSLKTRVVELVLRNYVLDRFLAPTPVSFFEPSFAWQKEKAMAGASLSMDMLGRSIDQIDYEEVVQALPGFVKNWGYSWRTLGIAAKNNRPLVSNTERQAIKRLLLDAQTLGVEGATAKVDGLLDAPAAARTIAAGTAWSDQANSAPYDDLAEALQKVAETDYEVPLGWTVGIHPTNASEARRKKNANTDRTEWEVIQKNLGNRLTFIETTAIPEGTILGVPKGNEFAELATTGVPTVVPVKADAVSVEYQARMIAIPVFYDKTPFFKITGV